MGLFKKKKRLKMTAVELPSITGNMCVTLGEGETIKLGNAQDRGARPYQEDSLGFSDLSEEKVLTKGVMAVMADGMGGLSNGKEASENAVRMFLSCFNDYDGKIEISEILPDIVEQIDENIHRGFNDEGVHTGTTLVAAMVKRGKLYWVSVGDSRLLLIRKNKVIQATEDGDYLNDLLEAVIDGEITREEAFSDEQRNSLPYFIGRGNGIKIDSNKTGLALKDGDTLILCSDGVYNAISKEEILESITDDAQETAEKLKDAVLAKEYVTQDNLTAVVMIYKKTNIIGTTVQINS